jgi:TnpA family transposase
LAGAAPPRPVHQTGTVTASGILRKLAAYPRQNGLALALRALGKLERTFLTLQWLQDPDLRRRSHVGLNKGEQQNALRRAVFFNRLGEIRDRSYENQRYRASGLNLLVAAIFYGIRLICSAPSIISGPSVTTWLGAH